MWYAQWDSVNQEIITGPQGMPGDGDNWYPYVDGPELTDPVNQIEEHYLDSDQLVISWRLIDAPAPLYDQQRNWEYPPIHDQLDKLWHDIENGTLDTTGEFYSAIKQIKDMYPKP